MLSLPQGGPIAPWQVHVAENGSPVAGAVVRPLRSAASGDFGVILAIDVSPSMHGEALQNAKRATRTSVICIEADRYEAVPDNESWWDVPVAEVSTVDAVNAARRDYEKSKKKQQPYL